ncbi:MAG: hypothetical protein PHE68_05490 [Candidatus Peribacteraceae bacterium]|nr:hypothetical protein [Candidatus Peribacteraceae bacterium]MDD5075335.1 hypothetical protein [Candidatus Peribacteraceae bacterium]
MHLLDSLPGLLVEKAFAQAQNPWDIYCRIFHSSCGDGRAAVADLAGNIADFFYILIGGGAVVAVIIAGIKIVFSGGNDGKIEEGKKIVAFAAAGVVLAVAAWSLIQMVEETIGSL